MALSIKVSSYVSAGYTGDVITWKLKETGTGIYVDSHSEAGPHGQTYRFSFVNNIRDIVYTIEMYDVDTLMKSDDVTASTQSIDFDTDLELVVDGGTDIDPVAGENSVVIPDTIGKKYRVVQRGVGPLLKTRNVEFIPDDVNGGFALTDGQTFDSQDVYVIQFLPTIITNPLGSITGGGAYKGIKYIDADYDILSTDFGSLLIVNGALPVLTLTLPADIPEGIPLNIESVGLYNNNVVISGAITFNGAADNNLILGKAEGAQLLKLAGVVYGFSNSNDIKKVGSLDWGYMLSLNRMWADGTELNQSDYPRLLKFINKLPPAQVMTSYDEWNFAENILYLHEDRTESDQGADILKTVYPNKGFYALYGGKIRVPDWRNKFVRALKSATGSDTERVDNLPGGYQIDSFLAHEHNMNGNKNGSSGGEGGVMVANYTGHEKVNSVNGGYKTIMATGGGETRGENLGQIPQIII